LRIVNFTNQFRFLFTDRTRLADVAVVYSLSSVFWRHAGVLSTGTNHSHEIHLKAACRLLEDTHKQYEIVALGHKGLWENELGIARLRKTPAEGGYKLVILPNVDAMSDADLALMSSYVQSGGRLIVTGTSGAFATASRDENLRLRGPGALDKLMKLSGKGSVNPLTTFAQYLSCTHDTCAKARGETAQEIDSINTGTGSAQFGAQLPPNVWQNVFVHGAGPMVAVHLVNYNVSGKVGTLTCRTCKLTNVPLEQPVHISVSMNSTANVKAILYQPGAPMQDLNISTQSGLHSVSIPRMDTYCVVVFATEDEFTARGTAARARTWLERALIASRTSGLPKGTKLDKSAMFSADKLLSRLQGDTAIRAANRPNAFFSTVNSALKEVVPQLRAYVDDVQKLVSSAEDTELAAVSSMCTRHTSCLAAFSFQQTARFSYKPVAKPVAGFTTIAGAPVYEASSRYGFTHPSADSIRDAKNPSLLSFDTLLPGDLHRGGIMSNQSAIFKVDLTLDSLLPKDLILTIVSGWHDLGAPNRSLHAGSDASDFGAWMGFASTSVSTSWSTAESTQPISCLLGVRGRNPGYFHTRACRVSLAGVQPGNVSLSIVFAVDGGTTGVVGDNTGWYPFAWLVNALALQRPDATRPAPVQNALAESDTQAASGVREFYWVGPFDADDGQGLTTVYPPEAEMMRTKCAPDNDARYIGKYDRSVAWQVYRVPVDSAAPYVPLGRLLGAHRGRNSTVGSAAFLMAEIHMNETQRVHMSTGMSGLGKVWVVAGGSVKPVIEDRLVSGLMAAENERTVTLNQGTSTIIMKSVHTFAADFVDSNGRWGPVGGPIQKDSDWGAALSLQVLDVEQLAIKSDDTIRPTLLHPLIEASGAAFGDAVAAGSFCDGTATVAVVDSASLTVSLLAGPTPHLVHQLRAPPPTPGLLGGMVTAAAAVDLDGDGSGELVIAVRPKSGVALAVAVPAMLLTVRFGTDCTDATIVSTTPMPASVLSLLPVPRALAAAGLVATLSSGTKPFSLLGLSSSGSLTVSSASDFGVSPSAGGWVAATSSGNRTSITCESLWDPKGGVVHPCSPLAGHPSPVLVVADSATTVYCLGINMSTGAVIVLSNTTTTHAPRSAAIVDFSGTGESVVVLVSQHDTIQDNRTMMATMMALPSLRMLGVQQVDINHSWSSVAAVSLSAAYGTTHDNDSRNISMIAPAKKMQQLLGLRAFPRLGICPGAVPNSPKWQGARSHPYGNKSHGLFCCEENLNGNCLNWTTSNIPCCLEPGTEGGCGDALPCTRIGSGEFVVSLLVYGDGALWLPRQQAIATSSKLQLDSVDPWTDGAARPGGPGLEGYLQMMKRVLSSTHSSAYAAGVCDGQRDSPPSTWLGNVTVVSYEVFVQMLHATRDFEVDRHQLRMWLILPPPTEADPNNGNCQVPTDSLLTPWNETEIFAGTGGYYTEAGYIAWSELVGRLARRYPHLM
jgi:hypothetical protein